MLASKSENSWLLILHRANADRGRNQLAPLQPFRRQDDARVTPINAAQAIASLGAEHEHVTT